jgi:PAS domain S-box-containing protein
MVLFDSNHRIVRANTAFAEMLGSTPEKLAGRSMVDVIHPSDRSRGQEAFHRVERRELTWVTVQQRCLRKDGESRWGEFATRIFWGANGEFLHALGIVRDITEAVVAQAALRESEIRNWRITESNMMGLFEWGDAVTISEANDAFLQMLGYSREDLRSGNIGWSEILPPDSQDLAIRLRDELLATGRIRPTRMEYRSRDGKRIPVLAGAARISWEPVKGIGFVLDMSEQRKIEAERANAEAALRQSLADLEQAQARLQLADRMASMGTLAAGVAHEINNPLGFVVANLGFAQDEVAVLRAADLNPAERERRLAALTWALGEAQEGAHRVRNIVLDLKMFSHPDAEMRTAVDLHRVIDSAVNLAQAEIRGRARVVRRFENVPAVLGNEARLSQLFLNLIVNAAHSIPPPSSNGSSGEQAPMPRHEIRLSIERTPAGWVRAEVTDTGVGIAAEHLARIFDPFFTTKPLGRGTGLGLWICHGIAQSLGGEINVTSTAGMGATFSVILPPADVSTASPLDPVRPVTEATPSGDRKRILVVDDEPLMGSAIARVLAEHEVVALTSARSALCRISAGERFDVILCDVMMPDFSGMDLYEAMARQAPELLDRLVFITGGAYTPDAVAFLDRVPNARLEKPILPRALYDAVASILPSVAPGAR